MKLLKTDKLECIDDTDCVSDSITKGKIYSLAEDYDDANLLPISIIYIFNDDNQVKGFFYRRFKRVKEMSQDFQVDTLNQEIYNQVLQIAEKNGFEIGAGMKKGYYRYLRIRDNVINGNNSDAGSKFISINEFCQMKLIKPIVVNGYKVVKTSDGIKVGCTNVSMEQIEEIYKFAKS